jgi:putative ABC transport system permease protein
MSRRLPWICRAALMAVPRPWRESVARDLGDEGSRGWLAGWRCGVEAVGIAVCLHWTFTRAAVMSDIRYAIRSMLRARWFTIGGILTYALGIGLNVAVFSAVDRMLFRTLPYARPSELYVLELVDKSRGTAYGTLPEAVVVELRRQRRGIVDACQAGFSSAFTLAQDPVDETPFHLTAVTYNTLALFGVHPLRGRDFTRDDAGGRRAEALIGYELWQTRFGGADDVIGRSVWADRKAVEIIGVLPRDFIAASSFLDVLSAGVVLDPDTMEAAGPRDRAVTPYVRLKQGVTPEAVAAEANVLDQQVRSALPPPPPGTAPTELRLVPLERVLFGNYRNYLVLVAAAAGLVLLVACGNLASLLLVRLRSREHVTAMQVALGASEWRLMTTAFIEAGVLSVAGAAVGLAVFTWASAGLRTVLPPVFSRYAASVSEPRVVVFTLLAAFVSAALVAVLPAWRTARVDAMSMLKRSSAAVRGHRLGGRGLLTIEAGLSVVLVAAAVATARSLVKLEQTDLGFEPRALYAVTIRLPATADANLRFHQYLQVLDILGRLSGVRQAAGTNDVFLSGSRGWKAFGKGFEREGSRSNVSGGYFETLAVPLLAGRSISAADVASHAPVAMLNRTGVELLWPGLTPAQAVRRLLPFDDEPRREVVGVVADLRSRHLASVRPELYLPLEPAEVRSLDLVARMDGGANPSVAELRERVRREVAEPTVVKVSSVTTSLEAGMLDHRFRAMLFLSFGAVALVLAAVGLYAVGTFEVTLRRAEMGIRITLGATANSLQRLVIREALTPVFAGVILGLLIVIWAGKFLQAFLYRVEANDPGTLVLVAGVFVGVTILAAWIPARRAARTDPAIVLRVQ